MTGEPMAKTARATLRMARRAVHHARCLARAGGRSEIERLETIERLVEARQALELLRFQEAMLAVELGDLERTLRAQHEGKAKAGAASELHQ